jgi:hypothetical protein
MLQRLVVEPEAQKSNIKGFPIQQFSAGTVQLEVGRAKAKLNGRALKGGNQASGFLPVTQIHPLLRSSKTSTAV